MSQGSETLFSKSLSSWNKIEPYTAIVQLSSPIAVDRILSSEKLTLFQKRMVVGNMLQYHIHLGFVIGPSTMSRLLEIKEDSPDFHLLYINLVRYAASKNIALFTYKHLYHLVLQSWMDLPRVFRNEFKKNLILIVLNGTLPIHFVHQIINDSVHWFGNTTNNEMIEWLCSLDKSGFLNRKRTDYLTEMRIQTMESKQFQKIHGITKKEYEAQQKNTKRNGICMFTRIGKPCKKGPTCKFYHGPIEETYGVQMCLNGLGGKSCALFSKGECRFVHEPTFEQVQQIIDFFKSLVRYRNGFLVWEKDLVRVQKEIRTNPFVILKLEKTIILRRKDKQELVYYFVVPGCQHVVNQDTQEKCNEPVMFVTTKDTEIKYYCSYKHMVESEPTSDFRVKQNIMNSKNGVWLSRMSTFLPHSVMTSLAQQRIGESAIVSVSGSGDAKVRRLY